MEITRDFIGCEPPIDTEFVYSQKMVGDLLERIAYLEKAYRELHRDTTAMMGEDKERIKVLEDEKNTLRASHAALVELVKSAYFNGFNTGFSEGMVEQRPYSKGGKSGNDLWPVSGTYKKLKAALAEVKG